jgi:hypothetical protein
MLVSLPGEVPLLYETRKRTIDAFEGLPYFAHFWSFEFCKGCGGVYGYGVFVV